MKSAEFKIRLENGREAVVMDMFIMERTDAVLIQIPGTPLDRDATLEALEDKASVLADPMMETYIHGAGEGETLPDWYFLTRLTRCDASDGLGTGLMLIGFLPPTVQGMCPADMIRRSMAAVTERNYLEMWLP